MMTGRLRSWMVPLFLLGTLTYALAEEITLTTYYPSPRGVYDELRTRGDVGIGKLDPPGARLEIVGSGAMTGTALRVRNVDQTPLLEVQNGGNVGIGTTSPSAKLEVAGQVKITGGSPGSDKVLTSNAEGVASWQAASWVPVGFVGFFNLPNCPAGWTELTEARGRYLVGLQPGATVGAVVGDDLGLVAGGLMESRPAGSHTHVYSKRYGDSALAQMGSGDAIGSVNLTTSDGGLVPGTIAPYIQLLACQKQ